MDARTVSGDDLVKLRPEILSRFREMQANPTTAPAAFGICCHRLMTELGCDLRVAALLLDCWVTEDKPPAANK